MNRERTDVSYIDVITKIAYEKPLISIAQDETVINQFDPSQACYIGILIGLQGKKSVNKLSHSKPILTLIKD